MGSRKQASDGRKTDRKDSSSHRRSRGGGTAVKVRRVRINHRRKAFEVTLGGTRLFFPFAKLDVKPLGNDPVHDVYVDKELGSQGFTYTLRSGKEGSVLADHVLEYNKDPD